jgi:prophage regulatory protein
MRMIREAECRATTGLSRSTRYRLERCGAFPRRRRLGKNSVGWPDDEVQAWLHSRSSNKLDNELAETRNPK